MITTPLSYVKHGQRAAALVSRRSSLSAIVKAITCTAAFAISLCAAQPAAAQYTQQGSKLVGSGASGVANQGKSVALSADGNTAVVGGPCDVTSSTSGSPPCPNGESGTGAVWVFVRTSGIWGQQGTKLVGTGAIGNAEQGFSVAVSADGNTLIEGGPGDNSGVGAAWVFTNNAGTWSLQQKLVIGGTAQLGTSVALSADGNTAVVGAPGYNFCCVGAAYVFTRSGGTWTEQAILAGSGNVGASEQGWSVALSANGNTAIVGGPADNNNIGAVWVFTQSGGTWTQQGTKLVGSGASGEQGSSVALSGDGNTALVGGPFANVNNTFMTGAVWVFTQSGGTWTQQGGLLLGSGAVNPAYQGYSVALSGDGNTAFEGGYESAGTGAVWAFVRTGTAWAQQGSALVGTGAVGNAQQGTSVALSADSNTAIVGGAADNSFAGAAWVFTQPSPLLAAVLPESRSVQVGGNATAFATIINTGTTAATSCSIAPGSGPPATFLYQTTNPTTNTLTGSANTPVNIAGDNGSQSFLIALTPSAPIAPTNELLIFTCTNTASAPIVTGLNTLLLSASTTPTPDVIALGATLQNDGIVHVTNGSPPTGVFAVATDNLGSGDTITVATNTGAATLPITVTVCQTDPTTGACLQTPSATVATAINSNATPTFGIFVSASGTVPFDPTDNRIFVTFTDSTNAIRGETSVAVETQ